MNQHSPQGYDIVNDVIENLPSGNKNWYGIILHSDTVIDEITVAGTKITNDATILLLIKDIPVGTPFLMDISAIKLTSGSCKMINPN